MSTIDQDDAFAAELRAIVEAEQPALRLDAATVTLGGRRRRRRRAVRNGALATLASAAVVVGVAQLADVSLPDTGPAGPTQEPRTFGTGQTAQLAPGIVAANLPETIEVDGTTVQDLGFTSKFVNDVAGRETPPMPSVLTTHPTEFLTGAAAAPYPRGQAAELQNVLDGELYDGMTVGWLDDESPERYSTFTEGAWSLTSSIGLPVWSHEQLVLGSVPSWLDAPRVVLYSQRGFTLADGGVEHGLEVPTFRALADDDRLVFAVKVTEEQGEFRGDDPDFLVDAVMYVHADGLFVGNQCGPDGITSCVEVHGGAFLLAAELSLDVAAAGGDLAVHTRGLATPPAAAPRWHVSGGRWVPQSAVGGVIVSNHFLSDTPEAPEGGPEWEEHVVGVDAETGAELWRWEVGAAGLPDCAPALDDERAMECWWYSDDDGSRRTIHDARTGEIVEDETRPRGPDSWETRYGSTSDHALLAGLLVGPDGRGGIVALDPATGDERWRTDAADRVLGFHDRVVYVSHVERGDGPFVVIGLDIADGTQVWGTELGADVIDVHAVGDYLVAIHGEDYSSFELGFSRLG